MFDVLKPPTDNLYKFVALSGLLLLIVSIVAPGYAIVTLEWKRLAALRELNITKGEIDQSQVVELELEAAKKEAQAALHAANAASLESDSAVAEKTKRGQLAALKKAGESLRDANKSLTDAQRRLAEKSDEFSNLAKSIRVRTIDNEYQGQVLETVSQLQTLSQICGVAGGLLGIILAIGGFALWYRKVQKFQDAILIQQSSEVLNRNQTE